MKLLIIGHKGSIGQRWVAVARAFGENITGYDLGSSDRLLQDNYDGVLIASPTTTHYKYLVKFCGVCPVLCEKPLLTTRYALKELWLLPGIEKIRIVSNWLWFCDDILPPGQNIISYNYFRAGNEDFVSNMAQPIYLAKKLSIKTTSPVFKCTINNLSISLDTIELSYVKCYENWKKSFISPDACSLWDITDAERMLKKMEKWEAYYGKNYLSSIQMHY